MESEYRFKTSLCKEYECLLLLSKAAFDDFRTKHDELLRSGQKDGATLFRRRTDYEEAYSRLVNHYETCELCQALAELTSKSQSRDDSVIPFKRRSA